MTMELFHIDNPLEELLARKASHSFSPLGGTMELLPLCNMDCRMCYVRQTRAQMEAQGRMLSCDEWLAIAEDLKENGVLYLLLTGGEPLMYPEFDRLYTTLTHMGFIISINTNATLLDEKWADLLAKYPCRRLNITLYGKDDETYGRLCNNPQGFTHVARAAKLLREREIPFRLTCSVTPYNANQLPELFRIAAEWGTLLEPCAYMFPPHRRTDNDHFIRLTPAEAAESYINTYIGKKSGDQLVQAAKNTLAQIKPPPDLSARLGPTCRAGRSGFWINWKGELLPCGMFAEPKISLLEHPFRDCWAHIVRQTLQIRRCADCDSCTKFALCKTCTAACLTETGTTDGRPDYLCQMTDELIRLCREIIEKEAPHGQR